MHVCLHVHTRTICTQCGQRSEGGVRSPRTVDTDSSALPSESQTRVFWKSSSARTEPGLQQFLLFVLKTTEYSQATRDRFQLWILLFLSTYLPKAEITKIDHHIQTTECWGRTRMLDKYCIQVAPQIMENYSWSKSDVIRSYHVPVVICDDLSYF